MEYRKLNYIKNEVNRCGAIDRAAAREQFPAYAPAFYFHQVQRYLSQLITTPDTIMQS